MDCGACRKVKLLERAMKTVERESWRTEYEDWLQ